tara:strand:+ start:300 stop:461 length:162 start_codon:yes stop_codon:yes gene_type:complete
MTKGKTKAQLIEENQELREEIENMHNTIKKLETRIFQLQRASLFGERGLPWRP